MTTNESVRKSYGDEMAEFIEREDRRRERRKRAKVEAKKSPPESQIQKDIIVWLKLNSIFHWRQNTQGKPIHVGDHAILTPSLARGVADIVGCLNGRMILIEVKRADWKPPSAKAMETAHLKWVREGKRDHYETYRHQLLFESKAIASGAVYILAKSVEDVARRLQPLMGQAQGEVSSSQR